MDDTRTSERMKRKPSGWGCISPFNERMCRVLYRTSTVSLCDYWGEPNFDQVETKQKTPRTNKTRRAIIFYLVV